MPHRFTYRGRRLAGEGPGELAVHLGPRKRRRGPGGRRRRNLFQEGREGHRASGHHGRYMPTMPNRRGHALREPRVPRGYRRRCMTSAGRSAAAGAASRLRPAGKRAVRRVIDARRDPVKQVMDITGNRGADVVIDLVGNDLTLANGMKMLHKGGTLIIVGYGG